jgi:hypothetical protein
MQFHFLFFSYYAVIRFTIRYEHQLVFVFYEELAYIGSYSY